MSAYSIRHRHPAGITALAVTVAASLTSCDKPVAKVEPGTTYASLEQLPDLSGWWVWQYTPEDQLPNGGPPGVFIYDAPFKPEITAIIQPMIKGLADTYAKVATPDAVRADDSYNKAGYCSPPKFTGVMGSAFDTWFEVLYTPGRVTFIDEEGLVRRVDLDKPLPVAVEVSNSGVSAGHWDGQTLVVETRRKGRIFPWYLPLESSDGPIDVVERFTLKDADLLQNDVVITAPNVFTKPYAHTFLYRRDRQHEFHDATNCVDYDRFGDPTRGKQRFDLTLPPDLPPPPKD